MNDDNVIIDSVAMLKDKLQEENGIEAKENEIRSVMKDNLDMRYKKILAASIHANSAKNLVLR